MADKALKTSVFIWEGTDKKGSKVKGELAGQNPMLVKAQLRKQGINPLKVRKKGITLFGAGKKIKPMDIALFTRQMSTMMGAGVPLLQSFDIIGEGFENPNMRKLVDEIKQDVAAGNSLASSLRKKPIYFDDLYCNLVDAGEQSGALETLLDRVATYKEKTESLKAKIKKAMTYPIAVIVVALVVSAILLIKVVPQFQSVFANFGAELPAFTQMVINLSEMLQEWWLIVLIGLFAAAFAFREAHRRSQKLRDSVDRGLLKLPIIGGILYKSAIARYARTLSTTFAAGVPLVEALDSVSGATGNVVFKNAVTKIKQDVSSGMQLNFSMRTTNVFPSMAIQMAAIGEESGSLDEMLGKVAGFYEEEVDNAVDNLTTLMEPMIMAVLGGRRPDHRYVSTDLPTGFRCVKMELLDYLASHPLAFVLCAILLGLLVGSFLNVVVHRLPKMMERNWKAEAREALGLEPEPKQATYNLVLPNSACPRCGHEIRPWENIPLVSYLALGGKCSSCKAAIGKRYPLVELATALLSGYVAWHFGFTWQAGAMLLLTWGLLAMSLIDADHQLLPDVLVLPLLWLGLIANHFGLFASLGDALFGAVFGYLSLWSVFWLFKLVTGKEGMGYGDFKLLAMLGAWGGWQILPLTILLSSLVGAILGVIMLRLRNAESGTPIPFGPYLAIAGWIALLWGDQITRTYLQFAGFK